MKIIFICFFILTSVFLIGCQDGSLESNFISEIEHFNNYPFKIQAKTTDEIEALQSEFDVLNENNICTDLDQFGFTDDIRPCHKNNIKKNITDHSLILTMVKATLIKNSKFTNVLDTMDLKVKRIDQHDTSPIDLQIIFENQAVEGITVEGTRIKVNFHGDYVCNIIGSWYPKVPLPPKEFGLSISEAKDKILGEKFEYSCMTGTKQITITRQSILDDYTDKCLHPIVNEKSIEFRVVYRFSIQEEDNQIPFHVVYVDLITGEILKYRSLISC